MDSASLTARDRPHLLREPVRGGAAYSGGSRRSLAWSRSGRFSPGAHPRRRWPG